MCHNHLRLLKTKFYDYVQIISLFLKQHCLFIKMKIVFRNLSVMHNYEKFNFN